MLTVIASDSYKTFVGDLQKEIKSALYERPTKATKEYFAGKVIKVDGQNVEISKEQAMKIERYLGFNGYIDYDGNVTDEYRNAQANGTLAPLPSDLAPLSDGIHKLVQGVFDEKVLDELVGSASKPKITENPLNDNFYKEEFKKLWNYINHKYAYTVEFDSEELIKKAIAHIDDKLIVSQLQYTTSIGQQKSEMNEHEVERGDSFKTAKTRTQTLQHAETSRVKYDLIGKVAEGTTLTRKTVAKILSGLRADKIYMFKHNPEEFISKVVKLINEQKATMIARYTGLVGSN